MSKRNKYNLDELDLLTKFRQVKRSNINLFTEDSSSQESVSYEHINSLDEGVCCSEKVPLLHSGRNMKITGGNYTEIYGISRTENADEQVTEKQRKRLRKKKIRKRLRRAIRTSWKWMARGFVGYLSTNWMFGFSVSPNDVYKAAYEIR